MIVSVLAYQYEFFRTVTQLTYPRTTLALNGSLAVTLSSEFNAINSSATILGNGQILYLNCQGSYLFQVFSGQIQDLTIIVASYNRYALANRLDSAKLLNVRIVCTSGRFVFGYAISAHIIGFSVEMLASTGEARVFENSVISTELSYILAPECVLAAQVTGGTVNQLIVNNLGPAFELDPSDALFCVVAHYKCTTIEAYTYSLEYGQRNNATLVLHQRIVGERTFTLRIWRFLCAPQELLLDESCIYQQCFYNSQICAAKAKCMDLKCDGCKRAFCAEADVSYALSIVFGALFGLFLLFSVVLTTIFLLTLRKYRPSVRRVKSLVSTNISKQNAINMALIQSK